MPRRKQKRRKRKPDPVRFEMRVTASSVSVGRMGPDIFTLEPAGESRSYIHVEGMLDRPVFRDLQTAAIQISDRDGPPGNPGAAIGGTIIWNIACTLPRGQFADLLALVLADKLVRVSMLFESVRRGNGILRSIDFRAVPVPSDIEDEEEG